MLVYQFRRKLNETNLGYLRDLFEKGSLKFTRPSEFNDPFDCCPTQVHELPDDAFPHIVGDRLNQGIQNALSAVHGIACFSSQPCSMRMWSHYGDQHRSIAVGFDLEALQTSVAINDRGFPMYRGPFRVQYSEVRPHVDDVNALTKKASEWSYEDEYRAISTLSPGRPEWGPNVWCIRRDTIKQIILGARMADQLKDNVIAMSRKNLPDVEIRKAVLNMKTYQIMIENLDDQPSVGQLCGFVRDPEGRWREIEPSR